MKKINRIVEILLRGMNERDLTAQLQRLRALRAGGEPNPEWIRATRATLMMQVENTIAHRNVFRVRPRHAWQIMQMFVPAPVVQYALRPVMVLGSLVVLVFGGWITTVNASLQSVPGDALYGVKLATEQAQLALAANGTKVKLQIDFAGRRVDEVTRIVENPNPKKAEHVTEAVSNLRRGVATAQESLSALKKSDPSGVSEAIKNLDRKAEEYHAALDRAGVASGEPAVQEQVAEAKKVVTEASVNAVQVLVAMHKEDKTSVSLNDLLTQIQGQVSFLGEKANKLNVASSTPAQAMVKDARAALEAAHVAITAKNPETAVAKLSQATSLLQTADSILLPVMVNATASSTVSTEGSATSSSAVLRNGEPVLPQTSSGSSTVRIAPPTRSDKPPVVK